jgi:hypothetical protein
MNKKEASPGLPEGEELKGETNELKNERGNKILTDRKSQFIGFSGYPKVSPFGRFERLIVNLKALL